MIINTDYEIINYNNSIDSDLIIEESREKKAAIQSLQNLSSDFSVPIYSCFDDIYPIFYKDLSKSKNLKRMIILSKTIAIICSYVASYPFIKPAKELSDNTTLKILFPLGEVVSWGSLSAWSACNIINQVSLNKNESGRKNVNLSNKIYWISIAFFGVCAELPAAYISYTYNKQIFWTIYTPLVYSFFDIQSLDGLIKKICNTDNIATRIIYRNTNKISVFKAKKNFVNLLNNAITAISKDNKLVLHLLIDMIVEKNEFPTKFKEDLLILLKYGLEIEMKRLNKSIFIRRGNQIVKLSGALASLASSFTDAYLVYEGSRLVISNNLINSLIIVISVVPSSYLSLSITRKVYSKLFYLIIKSLKKTCRIISEKKDIVCSKVSHSLLYKLGHAMAIATSAFGLGSLTTVMSNTFDLDTWWNASLCILVITSAGILTSNSMCDFSDVIIGKLLALKSTKDERVLKKFAKKINILLHYIEAMKTEEFIHFIEELQIHGLNIASLAYKLTDDPSMTNILKIVNDEISKNKINQNDYVDSRI